MHDDAHPSPEPFFPSEEMVSASELREFIFCERAWFLNKQGFQVSSEAQAQRVAGLAFHEARAGAANKGRSPQAVWWAILLALAAIALIYLTVLMDRR
jgi:hypothetical protein